MGDLLPALRLAAERHFEQYVADLATWVGIDSGTGDHDGVRLLGDLLTDRLSALGAEVERPGPPGGAPAVVGTLRGRGTARILMCGHLDTVFAHGTAAERPFAADGSVATGPGVCDDKGGLLAGLTAMSVLQECHVDDFAVLTLLATPDEETGSTRTRELLTSLARCHDVGLCLEGAREDGRLVVGRKGVVDVVLEVRGRSAHAGIEPERGVNAALVAAGLSLRLSALAERWGDVSVNVGVLEGGERPNVVPDRARVVADVRAATTASFHAVVDEVQRLAGAVGSQVAGAEVTVSLVAAAPPWEADAAVERLAEAATDVAGRLDLDIGFARTGGSADANLLAAEGLPVLDGLGPVGGDDHTSREWLDLDSVVPRVTLLAGLVAELCDRSAAFARPPA